GVVADALRFVRQVVRVHANAVPTHQTRPERQEVPFGSSSFQYGLGINAQPVEDKGEFVDQGVVDVALWVLDHLGRLGHPDGGRFVSAGYNDVCVETIHQFDYFRGGTGSHLANVSHAVVLVTGIDALRAVTGVKVFIETQAGDTLQDRHTNFFGGAGIDRRLIDDNISTLQYSANGFAGPYQRSEVRLLVLVDGRRHRHDEHVGFRQRFRIVRVAQMHGCREVVVFHLQRVVAAFLKLIDAALVDIEAQHRALLAELHRQREAYVAETDHC